MRFIRGRAHLRKVGLRGAVIVNAVYGMNTNLINWWNEVTSCSVLAYANLFSGRSDQQINAPCFAYQVSGEYAMIEAAALNGWIDRDKVIFESLLSFKRAGCAGILSYYAINIAEILDSPL